MVQQDNQELHEGVNSVFQVAWWDNLQATQCDLKAAHQVTETWLVALESHLS
jgi:hypothetical protein